MYETLTLLLNGFDHPWVTMSEVAYADAGDEIEILLAVVIPYSGTASGDEG